MKKGIFYSFFFWFCLYFSCCNLFAQESGGDVNIVWGEEHKAASKSYIAKIVGIDENNIYSIREKPLLLSNEDESMQLYGLDMENFYQNPSIEIHSLSGNFIANQDIPTSIHTGSLNFENLVLSDNQVNLFTSKYDKKDKNNTLCLHYLDKETLQLSSIEELITIPAKNRYNKGGFFCKSSPNLKYFLIVQMTAHNLKKGEKGTVTLKVFDELLSLLWEKEINTKDYIAEKYDIDNLGNVYELVTIPLDKKSKSKVEYKHAIIVHSNEGNSINQHDVDFSPFFITNTCLNVSNPNQITFAGFYSKKNVDVNDSRSKHEINGVFSYSISDEDEIKLIEEFNEDFLKDYISEKKISKDKGLIKFKFDDILYRKDGSIILLAEQFYLNQYYLPIKNQSPQFTVEYVYGDIIIININPNGEVDWITKVPKEQTSSKDSGFYSSYASMNSGDNVYLLYNDNPKNLFPDSETEGRFKGKKNSVAVLATISPDGSLSRKPISDNQEENILIRPKTCKQVNDNQMVIYANWKGKNRLGILTIE